MSGTLTYQVRYRVKGTLEWINYGEVITTTNAKIIGLDPNTVYDVEVLSTNNNGVVASAVVSGITAALPLTPPTGLIISTIANSTTSLVLHWTPSASGSPPITYLPQSRVSGVGNFVTNPANQFADTVVFSGLTANTAYDFQVIATNSNGEATSAILTASTPAGFPPGSPTSLAVSNVLAASVHLTWKAPAAGTPPISYQVLQSTDGINFAPVGGPIAVLNTIISGLTPATTYSFSVQAINPFGIATSAAVSATTPVLGVKPAAATGLNVTNVTATSLQLNWTASATGTAPINYTVYRRLHNTGVYAAVANASGATNAIISGLTASTSYDFYVRASNAFGTVNSAVQTVSTVSAAVLAPSAPGTPTLVMTPTTATLSFTAPLSGAQPMIYQPQFRLTGTIPWTPYGLPISALRQTVDNLASATGYDFQIVAINAVGTAVSNTVAGTTLPTPTAGGGHPTNTVTGTQTSAPATGGTGGGGGGAPTNSFTGTNQSTAANPIVHGPASGSVATGASVAVPSLSLTDTYNQPTVQPGNGALNFACTNGTLSCTYGGTLFSGAQNTNYVSVSDSFSTLETVIGTLVYKGATAAGNDVLSIGFFNQLGNYAQLDVPINVAV